MSISEKDRAARQAALPADYVGFESREDAWYYGGVEALFFWKDGQMLLDLTDYREGTGGTIQVSDEQRAELVEFLTGPAPEGEPT